jgi:hypothetical protein
METLKDETLVDIGRLIQESREAAAQWLTSNVDQVQKRGGMVIPFPNTNGEARQYLHIPWLQVQALAHERLSAQAIYVYLSLWRQHILRKSRTVALTTKTLAGFGITRHQKTRALKRLERAGLLTVERHRGRNPLVTLNMDTSTGKS